MEKNEILHLAKLSKLTYKDEEIEKFGESFDNLLSLVDQVKNAKVEDCGSVYSVSIDDLREDEPKQSLSNEDILLNADKKEGGFFVVPLVVE